MKIKQYAEDELVFYEKQFTLTTYINEDGIYVRLLPFFIKNKFFSWDFISKAYIRKYNSVLEYGGRGIKYKSKFNLFRIKGFGFRIEGFDIRNIRNFRNFRKMNVAYTFFGNKGLQLELTDGRLILIGTRKPDEMEIVLRKLKKWEE